MSLTSLVVVGGGGGGKSSLPIRFAQGPFGTSKKLLKQKM